MQQPREMKIFSDVDAEEVESILETPTNIARNPNIRNDVDCYGMKWMKNNSLAKKGQNGPINPRTWDIQTITGRVLTKECESEKRISRPFGNIPS